MLPRLQLLDKSIKIQKAKAAAWNRRNHAAVCLACAFIPGRLALSHVGVVAKKLIGSILEMATKATFGVDAAADANMCGQLKYDDWGHLITPRYVKEAKVHVANVLLAYQFRILQSLVHELAIPRLLETVQQKKPAPALKPIDQVLVITVDAWDETWQHMSVSSGSRLLNMVAIDKAYLQAKLCGESVEGMTVSSMVHKMDLRIYNIFDAVVVFDEPLLAPLLRMQRGNAETIWTGLCRDMPLLPSQDCELWHLA